ncbi:MAG: hypothetical protein EB007_01385 [Betaproteobacteria bacterium]|nr:hypothetical protein [Betaproteobacteria bacterium]
MIGVICAVLATVPAAAAPLDGLLTALPERLAPLGYVELGSDHMNDALDVFRIRDSDPLTAGTKAGDYRGQYVNAAWRATDNLWLSGGVGQRRVSDAADTYRYNSWQLAGQYRFLEAAGRRPALALRLSGWGNRAAATESNTPVTVPGAILNTVKVTGPADQQLQSDLIGTWTMSPALDVSALLSLGASRLSYGALSATTTRNGCNYQLSFSGTILVARGKAAHTQNHNITLEADYRFHPHVSVFSRAQFSSNLFFNDIPVTYNSSTASRFGSKYSLFSVGLRAVF